jgi:hypothetical protein
MALAPFLGPLPRFDQDPCHHQEKEAWRTGGIILSIRLGYPKAPKRIDRFQLKVGIEETPSIAFRTPRSPRQTNEILVQDALIG